MALLTTHVRGNEILFTASPTDADGLAVAPSYVELQISFMNGGSRQNEVYAMSQQSDDTFRYVWDSSIADAGRVHWAVRSIDPATAEEGKFNLAANLANMDPSTP